MNLEQALIERELFEAEEVYDKEVSPLIDQIVKICTDHKISLMGCFQVANRLNPDGEGSYAHFRGFGAHHTPTVNPLLFELKAIIDKGGVFELLESQGLTATPITRH